jgi:FtsZ-interacting cell division protein ZipA
MSDLWMILVLLGVSIVLAVVIFNWWQEKKYRKDVEYRFSQSRADILDGDIPGRQAKDSTHKTAQAEKNAVSEDVEGWMSEPRVRQAPKFEPDFKIEDTPKAKPATAHQQGKVEPVKTADELRIKSTQTKAEPSISESHKPSAQLASVEYDQQAIDDAVSDLSHALESASEVFSEVIPEATPVVNLPSDLHTAMDWVGLIDAPLGVMLVELEDIQAEVRTFPHHATLWAQSASTSTWLDVLDMDAVAMQTQTPLSQVVCSLQLADRGGPVDQETLKRFQKSMETLSRALGLSIQWQGGYEPAQQAQSIDAFCIDVDKAVEFHVLANQGMFHATKLRGLAEACGLHLSKDGRFELFNAEGELEFSVRNYEGKPFSAEMLKSAVMTGVTFQLDIPTTSNSLHVFDNMVELARNMANSLSAGLIDVNRKPIGDVQLDKIRLQLKNISNAMAAQGIAPGSSHAKRLFS